MPPRSSRSLRRLCRTPPRLGLLLVCCFTLAGCRRNRFPTFPANYREFAYVTDGASGTVSVIDLVHLRPDRTLQVGHRPTGLATNPQRREVYAVNTESDSVSVIDAEQNRVAATLAVGHTPYFLTVDPAGQRGYVANAGSGTVTVLDLEHRRVLATVAAGPGATAGTGLAQISPDNRTLVVSNRLAGSVAVFTVSPDSAHPLGLRETFSGCPGATDIAVLPDSTKAFVACSDAHQILALWLGVPPDSWRGKQDKSLQSDHRLTLLEVGRTPTRLVLKPDGGEVFSMNFGGNSFSEVSTWTNEVSGTYSSVIEPSRGLISRDNNSLWITNFGSGSVSLYSIDDGRIEGSVRTGSRPDALAFSADEHLLLVTDVGSGDLAVLRLTGTSGPAHLTPIPPRTQPNHGVTHPFQTR